MAELQNGLPPGWDCKRDERTGKLYYVNHYTKTTTWDDPRTTRNRHLHTPKHSQNASNECIPMQHGTPELRRNYVYPSRSSPLPAFQMSPKNLQEISKLKMSPLSVRSPKVMDSSLTISSDKIDDTVAKVSGMFPTVSETHIRMLMKKYHSREALVISALQVEKHPITTPGPFATPPPQRNIHQPPLHHHHLVKSTGASPVCYRLPGGGSPAGFRSSPRPHSSPKLKLRYMKSIFPEADETIILDILQNNDNNIQKASNNLKEMGFERKDTVKEARQKIENKLEEERKEEEKEKRKNIAASSVQTGVKTAEEKQKVKEKLQGNYKDIAEHLISIALESVNFDEEKADQILQIIIQENTKSSITDEKDEVDNNLPSTSSAINDTIMPISQSRQSLKSLLKAEKDVEKTTFPRVIEENHVTYKSLNTTPTRGHNQDYAKGANEKLLLEEYVKWQGPNLSYRQGSNPSLLSKRTYKPCGPNKNLVKGHQCSLIKESLFSRFNQTVVVED